MSRPEDGGGTMDMILAGMDSTVDRRLQEVDVVMLGRVMVLLTDHSLDRRVVLLRELLA